MKKFIKKLFSVLAITALLAVVSCAEDDDLLQVDVSNTDMTSGYPLDVVTINGTNFNTVQFVFVGSRQSSFQLDGNTISFTVPEDAEGGVTDITLAMAEGYRVKLPFNVLIRPIPVIAAITPSAAPSGSNVTIIGTSLDNLETVSVGGVEAAVVATSATELVLTVPDGLPENLPAIIEIVTSGGEVESTSTFYVGQNLLLNSELEEGDGDEFTNWGKYNGGDGMTAVTGGDAYAGRSLKAVAAGGDAWRTQFASDGVATNVGDEYTVYMWIRAEATGGNIRFSTAPNPLYGGDIEIGTDWQQVEYIFTANEATTNVLLDMGVTDGAVYYVDNITMIATGAAGPQPVELLLNGGFEEGDADDFTNWNKFNGADLLTQTTNADEVRSGSRALRAVGFGGDAWRTQMASDVLVTEVGVEYMVGLWIKGEAGTPGDGGSIRLSTAGNGDAQYGADFAVTSEWQLLEWALTANGTETQIVLDMGLVADAVYFVDDVTFLAPPPPEPGANLLLNGGLEEGDADDFTNWNKFNGADLLTATTNGDEVRSGSRALRAVGFGADAWRTQFASDVVETEVDVEYTAVIWIKAEAGPGVGGSIRMSTAGNGDAQYQGSVTVTDAWQEVEWTFTANGTETQLVLDLGATESAVYFIDDIEFYQN